MDRTGTHLGDSAGRGSAAGQGSRRRFRFGASLSIRASISPNGRSCHRMCMRNDADLRLLTRSCHTNPAVCDTTVERYRGAAVARAPNASALRFDEKIALWGRSFSFLADARQSGALFKARRTQDQTRARIASRDRVGLVEGCRSVRKWRNKGRRPFRYRSAKAHPVGDRSDGGEGGRQL